MENKKIYLIISISILSILLISLAVTFAWFLPKTNTSIIQSGDIEVDIKGYVNQTEGEEKSNCEGYPKKLSNDESIKINFEFFDNILTFAFVIENKSKVDVDLELKLSDFSKYIFESYANEVSETLKKEALKYNSKFFLYFDKAKIVDGNDIAEETNINFNNITNDRKENDLNFVLPSFKCDDSTSYLWKYSYNNTFLKFNISAGKVVTVYFSLKNSQSSVSIKNDYLNWLNDYGVNYIKDIKNVEDEVLIKKFLQSYYEEEVSTLLNDGNEMILPNTNFNLDYFEFVVNSSKEYNEEA